MDTMLTPTDFEITNVTAVLPDRLVDDATIVVRDGVIADVATGTHRVHVGIDGRGAFCAPGAVDTHSDGLEKELRPRPGVLLPMEFAIRSFEGRVRAAGVTTIFHGVGFENGAKYDRSVEQAREICSSVGQRAASGVAPIDHRLLYRLDVRDPEGFAALRDVVGAAATASGADSATIPLVSYEDHTPGQGQYSDRRWMERYIAGTRGIADADAKEYIDQVIVERGAQLVHRDAALPWLAEYATAEVIRLMCHDPALATEVDEAVEMGVSIAEFPTSVAAAQAAHRRGLRIVCGAPNALRGESHSGNVSALELIAAGLCDSLASDYLPSTLFGAVGRLVDDELCTLPEAIRLITSGPAETVGLTDRGNLSAGQRADLVLFDLDTTFPTVRMTISQAETRADAAAATAGAASNGVVTDGLVGSIR